MDVHQIKVANLCLNGSKERLFIHVSVIRIVCIQNAPFYYNGMTSKKFSFVVTSKEKKIIVSIFKFFLYRFIALKDFNLKVDELNEGITEDCNKIIDPIWKLFSLY